MTEQQQHKHVLRQFMREHYTDERLAMLLAHAQNGKLAFYSCCCFAGVSTAQHKLQPRLENHIRRAWSEHGQTSSQIEGGDEASDAYYAIGRFDDDSRRRRILIPMIRAEMRRRENAKQIVTPTTSCEQIGGGDPTAKVLVR